MLMDTVSGIKTIDESLSDAFGRGTLKTQHGSTRAERLGRPASGVAHKEDVAPRPAR